MSLRFHKTAPLITLYHNPSSPTSLHALALLQRAQRSGDSSNSSGSSSSAAYSNFNNPTESSGSDFLREASSSTHGLELQLEVKERAKEPPTPGQVQTILGYLKQGGEGSGTGSGGEESGLGSILGFGLGEAKAKSRAHISREDPAASATPRRTPSATASSDPTRLSRGEMLTRVRAYQSNTATSDATTSTPSQLQPEPPIEDPPSSQSQWSQLDDSALVSRLKDSDLLLVDWDGGRAVTDLAGVERLVGQLREEQQERVDRESGNRGRGAGGGGCVVM
ncbi:hypothetical protein BCV69DRAFT_301472 [Microstroma glucosiphilum]|uniref:Uncharacterized protein n=1 Tax=Pseudomicrostroma glucosiphilum TaxID=1684307 RepID=A0A316U1H4_9BASI|nr:hypothetical protein BCV69DRAFT_301472 [Pseudomicrostroma glucosiphilum]PWN18341.1 hypothetical protein BCV69DRAFT_301472 [Pseudomicrostroma glucosiphilum]